MSLVDQDSHNILSSCCALTNAVKCVRDTGSQSSGTTGTMISNCSNHLLAEITELKPDIIITQGDHPKKTVLRLLNPVIIKDFTGRRSRKVYLYRRSNNQMIMTTPHPARLAGMRWAQQKMPDYFYEAIEEAKRIYQAF